MFQRLCWLLVLALGLTGCESDEESETGISGGTGSSTLQVIVWIDAEHQVPNAANPDDFSTTVSIEVSRDGEPVPDAVVQLQREGHDPRVLDWVPADQEYRGDHPAYSPGYTLTVLRSTEGLDVVDDVTILMPQIHRVVLPVDASTIPLGSDLRVTWEGEDSADFVEVRIGQWSDGWDFDEGEVMVPAAGLGQAAADGAQQSFTVVRGTRFAIEGGTAGSRVFGRVHNGYNVVNLAQ